MKITDYIPVGSKNAVSRRELRMITGLTDRKLRREIQSARRDMPICNTGTGYFIPDPSNPADTSAARRYYLSERLKANEILENLVKVGEIAYGMDIHY